MITKPMQFTEARKSKFEITTPRSEASFRTGSLNFRDHRVFSGIPYTLGDAVHPREPEIREPVAIAKKFLNTLGFS